MKIGTHTLGEDGCYIIAEMSCNHAGSFDTALAVVQAAKDAGANAIKFQHYTPETMGNTDRPITEGPWAGQTQGALYAEAAMPWAWTPALVAECARLNLDWLSTPYDATALTYLTQTVWARSPVALKVASFELTDLPFVAAVGRAGYPVLLSTGMATDAEIRVARAAVPRGEVVVLHCVSAYPTPPALANLRRMWHLQDTVDEWIGFSDHTAGIGVAIAGALQGAVVLEKHLKLAEAPPTADAAFSLTPLAFRQMVTAIRDAEAAMTYVPDDLRWASESASQQFRRAAGGPRGSYTHSHRGA